MTGRRGPLGFFGGGNPDGEDNTWLSRQAKPVIEQMRKELQPLLDEAKENVKTVKESVQKQEKKQDEILKVLKEILAELKILNSKPKP